MFKLIGMSALFVVALACAPAVAQTAPPPADQGPPPGAAADQGPPPGGGMGGKQSSKELIAGCRSDAKAKGLRGDELKSAVDECVGAQRPKVAARLQCRQQGKAQGLAGDDLKAFVKTCVAQGPQSSGQNMAPADQGPPPGAAADQGPPPGAGAPKPRSAARVQCRQQGKAQGLAGDDLKAFVKTCVAQGPQATGQPMPGPGDQGGPAPAGADQGPPPGAAADQGPPPGGAMGGKQSSKELIASCRSDAKAKGLRGDELKSAVDECVGAQKPKVAARLQCRQQGKSQGLAGDDLKAFVKTCVAQGPQ